MRTLIHILACSFCVLVVFAEDKFWVDANEEDRLWVNAKINGKVAGLSMDTGWGGENIILFRGAADRLGLKVRPYQGTGVGQIPFAVTEKCVVKLRWSFWSVTRVVGESGVIEWPSHVTQAIEDRFGERGFDGFVPWGLVSDKTIELDASNQTVRFLNKVPKEAAGWTKLALRKDWGILALETENPDGGKGVILVDTGSASGVGLATQKGREWKAAHTNQPVRLIMGYMVQPGLIVREQAWSDELSLGDLKLTDVVIEEADSLSLEKTRTEHDATFGMAALKRLNFIVDGKRGVAYLRPKRTPGTRPPFEQDRLVLVFVPRNVQSDDLVAEVVDGSAAYEAGIRDGDVLLKLDERDVATWRADPGEKWRIDPGNPFILPSSHNPAGTKLELTLKRNDDLLNATIDLTEIAVLAPETTSRP